MISLIQLQHYTTFCFTVLKLHQGIKENAKGYHLLMMKISLMKSNIAADDREIADTTNSAGP